MPEWKQGGASAAPQFTNVPASAALGEEIIFAGGRWGGQLLRTVQAYSTTAHKWRTLLGRMPLVESGMLEGAGEALYLFGGRPEGRQDRLGTQIYRMEADGNWDSAGSMAMAKLGAGTAVVGQNIYLIGGNSTVHGDRAAGMNIQVYHTAERVTRTASVTLPSPRDMPACQAIGESIYIVGGFYNDNDYTPTSTLYILDTAANTITAGPPSIAVATLGYAAAYGGELYYLATQMGGKGVLQVYNPESGSWRLESSLAFSSGNASDLRQVGDALFAVPDNTGTPMAYCDLRTAEIVGAAPASGFVDERRPVTFSWQLATRPEEIAQAGALFQWREGAGREVHQITVNGPEQQVTVPADTFPNGSLEWRVRATGENGVESGFTEWFTLTTVDEPPGAPTGLYPDGGTRNGAEEITFYWRHVSPCATPQAAFGLQVYNQSMDLWVNLVRESPTAEEFYTASPGAIDPNVVGERVQWRVRTYNSDGEAGAWSQAAAFQLYPAPPAPDWIMVERAKARPLCRWIAPGQVSYRLQALVGEECRYDSGWVYSPDSRHQVEDYLPRGNYTFRVRIMNEYANKSPWADYQGLVSFASRLRVTLEGQPVANGASLAWKGEVDAPDE